MSIESFRKALLSFLVDVEIRRRDRGLFDSHSIETVVAEIREFLSNYKDEADDYRAIIFDTKHKAFWRPDSRGYTIRTEDAGLYTLEEIARMNTTASCRYHIPFPPSTPLPLAANRVLEGYGG